MCGIYGQVSFTSAVDTARLLRHRDRLRHRGPDDSGAWFSGDQRVGLAQRRLAIIDLSPGGHQPFLSQDARCAVVFNGEIYNYQALRTELQGLGQAFRTESDTEVLLASYLMWGEDCLQRLNGMFSFVLYDGRSGPQSARLFMARDRAGEKPLYFRHNSTGFEFSSELKALDHSRDIDPQGLNHYLALGYVPDALCLFRGVHKLPPAHCGTLHLNTGGLSLRRYWALPVYQGGEAPANPSDLLAQAAALIEDSVRLRLIADVPVGVLLSGGLDSSLVTAAAARVSDRPVETFTIALPGSTLDEAHHAQKVANYFGTRHHVLPLDRPSLSLLDGLAPFIDEPIADSSILPAWLVFGLARRQVTVALGGDGGDELFGGYSDYTTSMTDAKRWGWVPEACLTQVARLASHLPAGVHGRNRLASLRHGPYQQMIWGRPYFDSRLRQRLLNQPLLHELGASLEAPERFLLSRFNMGVNPMDRMTRTHFGSILPDDFLVKVDRASMAHSLEVRAPFLDHRLIEFAFAHVPADWKVKDGASRRLQRLLGQQWLPGDLDTQRKQGFSIPLNEWLRQEGEARLLAKMEGLPKLINPDAVRGLVRGQLAGRTNGGRLFALMMLALAMRNAAS